MSQFNVEITELKTSESHWDYARGKAAQLKLAFKNKKAELDRAEQIKKQAKATQAPLGNDDLRRRALALAAQNRMVTV